MLGNEIRRKILENKQLIEQNASKFILNPSVQKAIEENEYLQSVCNHEYDELGYCIYCERKVD